MPVLQGSGEECRGRSDGFELGAVVTEAHDQRPGLEGAKRREQHVDALVLKQLADVDDDRAVRREEPLEALGVALVGQPVVTAPRVRWIASALLEQSSERLPARSGTELLDVDA